MKYFTINELCVSSSHPQYVEVPKIGTPPYNNLVKLVNTLLDPIREKLGKPITPSSGYRNDKLNQAVQGSKTSAHRYGLAADIHTGNNSSDNLLIVDALFKSGVPFDQCIIEYPTFNSKGEIIAAKWIHVGLSQTANRHQLLYTTNSKDYYTVKKKTCYTK